jgi:hypothetical protein
MSKIVLLFLASLSADVMSMEILDQDLESSMDIQTQRMFDQQLRPHFETNSSFGQMMIGKIMSARQSNKPPIEKATSIMPTGCEFQASNKELNELFSYRPVFKARPLHTLNFSGCKNLTDEHIVMMCSNPFFYRLKNINLEGTSVTYQGLQSILDSKIGSIRGLPSMSADSNYFTTVINVTIESDKISAEKTKIYKKFGFTIHYESPDGSPSHFDSSKGALKEIKLTIKPCSK